MKGDKRVGLIILDGWGKGDGTKSDAIHHAKTPVVDNLLAKHPNAELLTCGKHVGLPEGQMGNSEVGHLNIGAGRIVYQELTRINRFIDSGDFFENKVLVNAFEKAKKNNQTVHFIGLVSEGGVHSSQFHLHALCDMAKKYSIENSFIHAFTDGRDCDPKSGKGFLKNLEKHIAGSNVKIQSIIGRYYAMDRDKRWERVKKAYDLLVHSKGEKFNTLSAVFDKQYKEGITDEFLHPSFLSDNTAATIKPGDLVISFNFRTDRPREIIMALSQRNFPEYKMQKLALDLCTMTSYDDTFEGIDVIFEKENLKETLGEVLQNEKKSQLRIAETEKYPHVTFFFSGGRETPFQGERRILINSPKVPTYDLQPEMSAPEVTQKIIEALQTATPDFFCLNYANPDMVGHTGVYSAIVKAVETVDEQLGKLIDVATLKNYQLLIIADHGNADVAINPDGTANTAHSLNPVPVVLVNGKKGIGLQNGILADVAPTLLELMEVTKPTEMTGQSLIIKN